MKPHAAMRLGSMKKEGHTDIRQMPRDNHEQHRLPPVSTPDPETRHSRLRAADVPPCMTAQDGGDSSEPPQGCRNVLGSNAPANASAASAWSDAGILRMLQS